VVVDDDWGDVVVDFLGTVVAVVDDVVDGGSAARPVVVDVVLVDSGSVEAVVEEGGAVVVVDDDEEVVVDVASGPTSDNPSLSGVAVGMSFTLTPARDWRIRSPKMAAGKDPPVTARPCTWLIGWWGS
jgi:hypothetical protein